MLLLSYLIINFITKKHIINIAQKKFLFLFSENILILLSITCTNDKMARAKNLKKKKNRKEINILLSF